MATHKKRSYFFDSEEGRDFKSKLQQMEADSFYNTVTSYSPDAKKYPDNLIPFVDKHMNYLNGNPQLDSSMYLANLRLMTRLR